MIGLSAARAAVANERFDEAASILRPLAQAGDVEAQALLGSLWFTDCEIALAEARRWLEAAAQHEHPKALFELSILRHDGATGPPAEPASRQRLQRAADLGFAEAQRLLGTLLATGDDGWPLDLVAAREWLTRAARQGQAEAQYDLGLMWLLGEGGPLDPAVAEGWLRRAVESGHPAAADVLAERFGR